MKRIVCLMMTLMLVVSAASAQGFLKKLKKAVDTANEVVGTVTDGTSSTIDPSAEGRIVYPNDSFTKYARLALVSATGNPETNDVAVKVKMTLGSWPQYQDIHMINMFDVEGNEVPKGEAWNDANWTLDPSTGIYTSKGVFLPNTVTKLGSIIIKIGLNDISVCNIPINWQ